MDNLSEEQLNILAYLIQEEGMSPNDALNLAMEEGIISQEDADLINKEVEDNSQQQEKEYTVDNESPINDVDDNSEDNSNIPDWDKIAKQDAEEAGEKYKEDTGDGWGNDVTKYIGTISRDSKPLVEITKRLGNWIKKMPSNVQNDLFNNFADNAVKIFGKDKELVNELVAARKGMTGWKGLSDEARKKILGKFVGTLAQGLYTDAMMMYDVGNANSKGMNKANWRSGVFDAIDSATETLPIVSWVDLAADAAGGLIGGKDENGESYGRGGLLTKLSNLVDGDGSARTFWENNPEEQSEDIKAREWMKDRGYSGRFFANTNIIGNSSLAGLSTKKGSQADVEKKNDKAIDKIQGNNKGSGLPVKKDENNEFYIDKEQKDKGDAQKYIMYHNRANGKKLDDKGAYTHSDFTKDFKQDKNGTWVNKKTGQTAGEMMKIEKEKAYKKEGYKPEGETINI